MFLDVAIDRSHVPTQMDRSFLFDFLQLPPSHSSNEDPITLTLIPGLLKVQNNAAS
jgi:hypothetical protein